MDEETETEVRIPSLNVGGIQTKGREEHEPIDVHYDIYCSQYGDFLH
jgi:hypothetical protein